MTNFSFLVDLTKLTEFSETDGKKSNWIHVLPLGNYTHPVYGTINVDTARAQRFADSVNNKIRGIEPSVNYNHNNEDIAAGWGKKAESRSDGVWMFVEWTDAGAEKIKAKEYKYFSAEYADEWEDSQGNKHTDVIFGGALTNRPFMKNLAPINLAEETYNLAFDLVAAATGKSAEDLKGGNSVGLSEEEINKIIEGVASKVVSAKANDPAPTPAQKLSEMPELKALAEENPLVKALIAAVETQNLSLVDSAQRLKEADISRRLTEFDRSKLVLTPVARQRIASFANNIPQELSEDFWVILAEMKKSNAFLVELGERAGATVNYGSPRTAESELQDEVKKLRSADKAMSYAEAYEHIVRERPELYKRYRDEQNAGVTN